MNKSIGWSLALLVCLLLLAGAATALPPAPLAAAQPAALLEPFAPSGHFEFYGPPGKGQLLVPAANSPLVVNHQGLYLALNGSDRWMNLAAPDFAGQMDDGAADIAWDGQRWVLFAGGMYSPTLQISYDLGQSWQPTQIIEDRALQLVVASPTFSLDQTLFAVSENQLYRSRDGGHTWKVLLLPASFPQKLALSPLFAFNNTAYLLGGGHLYRSRDGGESWLPADAGLALEQGNELYDFGLSPLDRQVDALVVATKAALVISLDGGASDLWYLLARGTAGRVFVPADFSSTLSLFVSSGNKLLRTLDAGENWQTLLPDSTIDQVAFSQSFHNDRTLYATVSEDNGLLVSRDNGDNWAVLSHSALEGALRELVPSPRWQADRTLFAASYSEQPWEWQVVKSVDQGRSWQILRRTAEHYDLAISPAYGSDQTLYQASRDGLWRTQDGGATWQWLSALPAEPAHSKVKVVLSPGFASDRQVFLAIKAGGVFRSSDAGLTWQHLPGTLSTYATDLELSPGYPADPTILAGSDHGLLRYDGTTWVIVEEGIHFHELTLSPAFVEDGTLFAFPGDGSNGPIYRSQDRGATWKQVGGEYARADELAISPNFAQDQTLLRKVGTGSPLYISEDAGESWFPLRTANASRSPVLLYDEQGWLQILAAGRQRLYSYQWPLQTAPAGKVALAIRPDAAATYAGASYVFPQADPAVRWTINETTPWLEVSPTAGSVGQPALLTLVPPTMTLPANTAMTVNLHYSLNQVRSYQVSVRAFSAPYQGFLPLNSVAASRQPLQRQSPAALLPVPATNPLLSELEPVSEEELSLNGQR